MRHLTLRVGQETKRLDRYIAECQPELSRAAVQRLIREGQVLVNGRPAKPSLVPAPGDLISIAVEIAEPHLLPQAEALPGLAIAYEDEHLLVVDKPAGLVVHPGAGHPSGTLVNALLAHRPDLVRADMDPQRPGIVHRLDRDTSGLLVVACHRQAQQALQRMFRAHEVQKTYLALLRGRLQPERGAIEARLGRDPRHRTKVTVLAQGGRFARTEYQVTEFLPGCALVEAKPITGRMHQLRVHFQAVGHPVMGDSTYGGGSEVISPGVVLARQFLHAWRLALVHPMTGAPLALESSLPADLVVVLEALRKANSRMGRATS